MSNIKIVNGHVWIDGRFEDAEILVRGGKIKKVSKATDQAAEIFDAKGCLVLPGLVDAHTHLRDWGESYKEDIETGTSSAVAGGFTTLLEMPNTHPPIDSPERLSERMKTIRRGAHCDIACLAIPRSSSEVQKMRDTGAIALKVYMHKSLDTEDYSNPDSLSNLLAAAARDDMLVVFHAEHPALLKVMPEGYNAEDHSRAHPAVAEVEAIKLIIEIMGLLSKPRVHIAHISTRRGLALVRGAKKQGIRVTCEATPHHLLLTKRTLSTVGRMASVEPPLRTADDIKALQAGLARRTVDLLATDHAPHAFHEKASSSPPPGFPGLETALSLGLRLVGQQAFSLATLITALTTRPAHVFGLIDRGEIKPGLVANLTLLDAKKKWTIDSSQFESKAHYSPFDGWEVRGKIYATIVNGSVAYLDGEGVSEEFAGRCLQAP